MSSARRNEVCGVRSYMVCYVPVLLESHAANKTTPHLHIPDRATQVPQEEAFMKLSDVTGKLTECQSVRFVGCKQTFART